MIKFTPLIQQQLIYFKKKTNKQETMVHSIVKKIMMTGILKYAKLYNTSSDKIQIKVTIDSEGYVNYHICESYKEKEQVKFLDIMDKKIDILGYEQMATPTLGQCLVSFANDQGCFQTDVSVFIGDYQSQVVLSYYKGFKSIKNITLKSQLESIGL